MEIYAATTLDTLSPFRVSFHEHFTAKTETLIKAARAGDLASVEAPLQSEEIGINVSDEATGETAWSAALCNGHLAVCQYLMKRGARVGGRCWVKDECHSFGVAAVLTGNIGVVRHVAAQGVPWVSKGGATTSTCALAEAVRMGSIGMIETLLELGAHLDRYNNGLELPLFFKDILRSRSSSVDIGATPWQLFSAACWFQDRVIFDYLTTKYAVLQDLRQSPRCAARVLFLAVHRENDEMVDELLRRGAPVNGRDRFCPLQAAVHANSLRMLDLLLAQGADLSVDYFRATHMRSLLTSAVSWGSDDCARRLLPLVTRTDFQREAFKMAISRNNHELASLISEHIAELSVDDLRDCIKAARCPLILDFLLTKYCGDQTSVSTFHNEFAWLCRGTASVDLVGVFVAHGNDVTLNTRVGSNETTPDVMDNMLKHSGDTGITLATLEFVLASGMPSLTTDYSGMTPEEDMKNRESSDCETKKGFYRACQAILAAYS